ncbi:MAG TPA: cation:proton antiporter regulatory subunit [Actinomycetota bacterium]
MAVVNEVPLPGIGVRYDFVTEDGTRVGVIHHRTGEREIVLYERDDPDTSHDVLRLGAEDGRTLAELLGVSQVAKDLAELEQDVEGLAVDRLPLSPGTPFVGRTIGDTEARTRTGVSIVAVLRSGGANPAPGPEFGLEAGDVLVVVGTPRGIEDLAILLRSG